MKPVSSDSELTVARTLCTAAEMSATLNDMDCARRLAEKAHRALESVSRTIAKAKSAANWTRQQLAALKERLQSLQQQLG